MLSPFLPNRVNVFVNYLECRWNKLNRSHIILVMGLDQGDVSFGFALVPIHSSRARTDRKESVKKKEGLLKFQEALSCYIGQQFISNTFR